MMRKMIFQAFIVFIAILSCKSGMETSNTNPSGFEIRRGTNLSHWLSQDFGWAPKYTYINENDIKFISSTGFDHVRIPIDEKEMWDENGAPIKEAFDQLVSCLDWCSKYNLRAIVDLHTIRAHHFNAANEGKTNALWTDSAAQENFVNLWIKLSETLKRYPNNMVAYEILNEAVAPQHDDWNKLLNKAIAAVRKLEPERVIVIGANRWQIPQNLQYLKFPENDKNFILSFHTYSPMALTHYTANWTPIQNYKGPVHYPGQIITSEDYAKYVDTTNQPLVNALADARDTFNRDRLFEVFKSGVEFAKSKNLQIYCGEFGCLPACERKDRLQYYTDIISLFEENNVAWCNWEYKGDFGIYFFDKDSKKSVEPDKELISIFMRNKK